MLQNFREHGKIIFQSIPYKELEKELTDYHKIKQKTGSWVYRYFSEFIVWYSTVLVLALANMAMISLWDLDIISQLLFIGLIAASLAARARAT